jgi:hypothetical protein
MPGSIERSRRTVKPGPLPAVGGHAGEVAGEAGIGGIDDEGIHQVLGIDRVLLAECVEAGQHKKEEDEIISSWHQRIRVR